jgi:hypothetical protein
MDSRLCGNDETIAGANARLVGSVAAIGADKEIARFGIVKYGKRRWIDRVGRDGLAPSYAISSLRNDGAETILLLRGTLASQAAASSRV